MTMQNSRIAKRMNPNGAGAARFLVMQQLCLYTRPMSVTDLQHVLMENKMNHSRHFINDIIAELKVIDPLPGYELKATSVRTAKGTSKCLAYQFVKVKMKQHA